MKLRELGWYELGVRDFLARISGTGPADPPGAIGTIALALAGSAALLSKCTPDPELTSTLDAAVDEVLHVAVLDGRAYLQWRNGDRSSNAIEQFPRTIAALAERVVLIGETMPPNVLTGLTDIVAATKLAAGCSKAAAAVRDGNVGLL